MGTHCQLQVINKQGELSRVERTMDGYLILDEMINIVEDILNDKIVVPNAYEEDIGSGMVQYDEDCEDDYQYLVVINYLDKSLKYSFAPITNLMILALAKLIQQGWTIGLEDI